MAYGRRYHSTPIHTQKGIARRKAKVAYGTDCGMFPFSHGIQEFQAIVAAGLLPVRALNAATSVAAELMERDDLGVLAPGMKADIVAMAGVPLANIAVTTTVDLVMEADRVYRHGSYDILQLRSARFCRLGFHRGGKTVLYDHKPSQTDGSPEPSA